MCSLEMLEGAGKLIVKQTKSPVDYRVTLVRLEGRPDLSGRGRLKGRFCDIQMALGSRTELELQGGERLILRILSITSDGASDFECFVTSEMVALTESRSSLQVA